MGNSNVSFWCVDAHLSDKTRYHGKASRTVVDGKPEWALIPQVGVSVPIKPSQLDRVLNVMVKG